MEYTLMHKSIPVLDIVLDEATSSIQKIRKVYRPEHLPFGTASKHAGVDRAALNAWWIDRSSPASRSGVRSSWSRRPSASSVLTARKRVMQSLSVTRAAL